MKAEKQPEDYNDDFELEPGSEDAGFLHEDLGDLWEEGSEHADLRPYSDPHLAVAETKLDMNFLKSIEQDMDSLEKRQLVTKKGVLEAFADLERKLQKIKDQISKSFQVKSFSSLLRLQSEKKLPLEISDMIDMIQDIGARIVVGRSDKMNLLAEYQKIHQRKGA